MSTQVVQEAQATTREAPRAIAAAPAGARRRWWLWLGLALLLAAAGYLTWRQFFTTARIEYRLAAVERGDIMATVNASGNLAAINNVEVGSQASGRIQTLYVDFNSRVRKGQLLAALEPSEFQSRVDQSQANLQAAQASVSEALAGISRAQAGMSSAAADVRNSETAILRAQVDLKDKQLKMARARNLYAQGFISQADRETAETSHAIAVQQLAGTRAQKSSALAQVQTARAALATAQASYQGAQARLKQAQASLRAAQLDLSRTKITSPIDGVVVQRAMDVGQTVAASFQAPKLFVVADLKKMRVTAHIDEADVGKLKVGQPVEFNVDAYPRDSFKGAVDQVRLSPTTEQNVVTYDAIIGVDNRAMKLKPGMTANLIITVDRKENVLKVPNGALRYRPSTVNTDEQAGSGWRQGRNGSGQGGNGDGHQGRQRQRNMSDRGRVWILDEKGQPEAVRVRIGISDDSATEVRSRDLQEGQQVIVGEVSPNASASPSTTTPFGNIGRPRGGGSRGGSGGR